MTRIRVALLMVLVGVAVLAASDATAHVRDGKGRFYFGGSTYNTDQPRNELPRRRYRSDPMSVIWRTAGQSVGTGDAISHTREHWRERFIPDRFPRGARMNLRETNPFCRDPQLVFMRGGPARQRYQTSDYYMSTNGTCGNQYHVRLWTSRIHADIFGPSHSFDWALTPIHHERVGGNFRHEIDLPFDQARFVYARVMESVHCVDRRFGIHPHSEGVQYGDGGGGYSGIISRISVNHC